MSVNSSLHLHLHYCFDSRVSSLMYSSFLMTKVLLLIPLFILVFYLGYQQWRRQRSAPISHSDFFTYHMATMELSTLVFVVFYWCGTNAGLPMMARVSFHVCNMGFAGEMYFHVLTCVARYLAVVHPVTYLGLSQSGGIRIRTISVLCVWLLCVGWTAATTLSEPNFPIIPFFFILCFCLLAVSFCSLSVLCGLIRPRPGEVGGDQNQVDQSKQRAFLTVTAITAVLWLWFTGCTVCTALHASQLFIHGDGCVMLVSAVWFSLPSALVLPLLFLHRARKLQRCRDDIN